VATVVGGSVQYDARHTRATSPPTKRKR